MKQNFCNNYVWYLLFAFLGIKIIIVREFDMLLLNHRFSDFCALSCLSKKPTCANLYSPYSKNKGNLCNLPDNFESGLSQHHHMLISTILKIQRTTKAKKKKSIDHRKTLIWRLSIILWNRVLVTLILVKKLLENNSNSLINKYKRRLSKQDFH